MCTNVESSQVLAVLVEGVVVELGELLCVVLSSFRLPKSYSKNGAAQRCTLTSDNVEV